ncbi:hypothetical protein [Halomonas sp. AOP42-D1-22]|uniref:hypothetical protein n=1 Tax=Halomonas sp. AOP42-D1-22 TaxID=3457667 RepID=UPI004034B631
MTRRAVQLLLLVAAFAGGLAWMHFQVMPGIRWSNGNGVFYGEWRAVLKAWPVMLIAGGGAAVLGFVFFGYIGESERERSHKQRADEAEEQASESKKIADNATQRAEAALNDDRSELQRQQQQAEQQIKLAQSERKAAADEIEAIRAENDALTDKLNQKESRLRGYEKARRNGEAENKRLREAKGDPEALAEANAEIARLKSDLKDTRQRLLNKN